MHRNGQIGSIYNLICKISCLLQPNGHLLVFAPQRVLQTHPPKGQYCTYVISCESRRRRKSVELESSGYRICSWIVVWIGIRSSDCFIQAKVARQVKPFVLFWFSHLILESLCYHSLFLAWPLSFHSVFVLTHSLCFYLCISSHKHTHSLYSLTFVFVFVERRE